jgi:hypothetical protein
MLTALVAAMTTMARSLRMVEQRTGQMALKQGQWMDVQKRIADNTFGKVLPRLEVGELMALCILAVARKLSRLGYSDETPSWGQVAEHFLLQLCASNLETKAFDCV